MLYHNVSSSDNYIPDPAGRFDPNRCFLLIKISEFRIRNEKSASVVEGAFLPISLQNKCWGMVMMRMPYAI